MLSAGAFVCGEETALMAAIEGRRAMPRTRPPFPATQGLWDKPTTINNVETLSHVPTIMVTGGKEYAKIGSEKSKGTKVYCLAGKINRTGAAEVPIGTSMRELVFGIGGGVGGGKKFKAVQIGGPSGGCLSESCLDLSLDYESLQSAGAIMGSGGIIIANEDTCIVDLAKYFLTFTTTESCGKCTPCRIGLPKMLDILTRITDGKGEAEDIPRLQEIAVSVADSSLCALGRTAPNPVLTTIKYFRDEYESHIKDKRCPAHVCPNLISYRVEPAQCVACGLCFKNCPNDAIRLEETFDESTHSVMKKAVIDMAKCIHCGLCFEICPKDAIAKE
jgi:NADH-quinone oxidoreductase subunit F/NADP-reducing hydrogenase subunit HndC